MRSIERRFSKVKKRNPFLGLFFCLKEAATGQKFSSRTISRFFNKYIPEADYSPESKKELIADLVRCSNPLEDDK